MSVMDIEFGWSTERFDLKDVVIGSSVELQEFDGESWLQRTTLNFFSFDEEETEKRIKEFEEGIKKVRYSSPRRFLRAKGIYTGHYASMYLGVPEDGKRASARAERLDYVDIFIGESVEEPDKNATQFGRVRYSEAGEAWPESTSIAFYIPSKVLDDIEGMASDRNSSFQLEINMKGYHFTGPIGDSQIYIDTEKVHPAEFIGLTSTRHFNNVNEDEVVEIEEPNAMRGFSQQEVDSNLHLFARLSEIGKLMSSIKVAAWIAAIALAFLAIQQIR